MFWSRVMFHIRETTEETAREACVWDPVNVRQGYLQASGTSAVEELFTRAQEHLDVSATSGWQARCHVVY